MFKDRREAGLKLAERLLGYSGEEMVVFGLPRGGVVVAAEVARVLDAPLDLIIARKIGHPFSPEYAIGAVTETGEAVWNEIERAQLPAAQQAALVQKERAEAARRRVAYLGQRSLAPLAYKTAILVDDGIATGLTVKAAIREVRQRQPKKLVLAVPVIPADTAAVLKKEVDDLVALEIPEFFLGAVGAYYEDFTQTTDEEVVSLLSHYYVR